MRKPILAPSELTASSVYLTAASFGSAISNSDLKTVNKKRGIRCRNGCESIINDMLTVFLDSSSLFKRRHFDSSIIILCVGWYIAYKLSSRDLRDLMAERGIKLSHTTSKTGKEERSSKKG
jgi:hypothetical protein